jgi:uncharacterized membrane protein YfcA
VKRRRPTRREASWINVLILLVGTFVMVLGGGYLARTVDHFGLVFAYIALVMAIEMALVVYIKRVSRPE